MLQMENSLVQATSAVTKKCTSIVRNSTSLVLSGKLQEAAIQLCSLKDEIEKIIRFIERNIRIQEWEEEKLIRKEERLKREIGQLALKEERLNGEQRIYQQELEKKMKQLQEAKNELSNAVSERIHADEDLERVEEETQDEIITVSIVSGVATVFLGPIGILIATELIASTIDDAENRLIRAKSAVQRRSSGVRTARERVSELQSKMQTVKMELKFCRDKIAELNHKMRECYNQTDRVKKMIIFFKRGIEFWTLQQTLSEEIIGRSDLLVTVLKKSSEKPSALQHSSGAKVLTKAFLEAWEEFITKSEIGFSNHYSYR